MSKEKGTLNEQLSEVFNKKPYRHKETKHTSKKRDTGILFEHVKIKKIAGMEKDHINISPYDRSPLARKLSMEYSCNFKHDFGVFVSLEYFMRHINTPDLPVEMNREMPRNRFYKEVIKMGLRTMDVQNYWSIVLGAIWQRINNSKDLKNELKNSKGEFTSYHITKNKEKNLSLITYHTNMGRYVGCLSLIRNVLKETNDTKVQDLMINVLMMKAKDDPSKHIYSNVHFILQGDLPKEKTIEELESEISLPCLEKEVKTDKTQKRGECKTHVHVDGVGSQEVLEKKEVEKM